MDASEILVTIGGLALVGAVLIFFFGPRRRRDRKRSI
ncbi:MAG: hypothetical protein H6Q09_1576 [Acidobacteria bacterium]|jgi:hypothetical protein|nr:hypothetical protein [Acidobacteriota bacterium]